MSTPLGKWVPARFVYLNLASYLPSDYSSTDLIAKFRVLKAKEELWALYVPKRFSVPPRIRIITSPELLEVVRDEYIYQNAEFGGKTGVFNRSESSTPRRELVLAKRVRFKTVGPFVVGLFTKPESIHVLPPTRPTQPKYDVYVIGLDVRSTGMGARTGWTITPEPVYETTNSSSSGNHGILYVVVVTPKGEPVRLMKHDISNRGNRYEDIALIRITDDNQVKIEWKERYETLEEKVLNEYVKYKKIRDNWKNEEIEVLELELHKAWKTCAGTYHTIEPSDAVALLYSTAHSSKTHWKEVYRIVKKPVKIVTTRISNSCKRYEYETVIQ